MIYDICNNVSYLASQTLLFSLVKSSNRVVTGNYARMYLNAI